MSQKLNCIMLIDDDEPTNFLSNMIIEDSGLAKHILIEDSGKSALKYLANSATFTHSDEDNPWPDLIFLDVNMPAMNGWEFLDEYKELDKTHRKKIKIVMLTTSLNPDDEIRAKQITCITDFKHKPLTEQIVNEIIEKYFQESFSH